MGDGADSSAASSGRGLKRTPTRRYSTGSDAVPATAAGFQTPRATMATRDPHGWGKPRISTSHITNAKDKADAEEWIARLDTFPLYGRVLSSRGRAVQAWLYEKRAVEGTYVCYMADGEAEKLPIEEVRRRGQEATQIQMQTGHIHTFIPELLPGLCEFFAKYPRESPQVPPYTQWKSLFHIHSHDLWISVRCQVCEKMRRVALEYLTIVRSRLLDGVWRRCAALEGVECGREDASTLCTLNFKYLFNSTRLQSTTDTQHQRRSINRSQGRIWSLQQRRKNSQIMMSEYGGSQDCIEGDYHSPALIEMWKSLGKSLRQPSYSGEGSPHHLNAWQEDVAMFLKVYNVTGESQVLAASKFLRGEAEEWWHGLQATGRHRQIQTLSQLHQELRRRFFPLDRLERLAKQWVTLRQQGGVEEYREEFCLLQAAYPLGERAEFMLAYQGLKPMMRAEIRQALDDGAQEQIPCERLFTLARKAEVRSFREDYTHTATARDALKNHKKGMNSIGNRVTTGQQRNSVAHSHKNTAETRGGTTRAAQTVIAQDYSKSTPAGFAT